MAWLRCTGSPREETVPVSPSAGPSAPPDRPTSSTLSGWSVTSWSGTKAARPSRGLEQPFGFQPRPEARRVRNKMRLHPHRPRPIDVDEPVVDEQRLRRLQAAPVQRAILKRGIGICDLPLARHADAAALAEQ